MAIKIKANVLDVIFGDFKGTPEYVSDKFIKINSTEDGVEFADVPDVPDPTGNGDKLIQANDGGTDVEYSNLPLIPKLQQNFSDRVLYINDTGTSFEWRDLPNVNLLNLSLRINSLEYNILNMIIENRYMAGRVSYSDYFFTELFYDDSQTKIDNPADEHAEIMGDTDFNNAWKYDENRLIFKPTHLRPKEQRFMLEIVDEFNLEGVGQTCKCGMSQYDSTNDCMWLMTTSGTSSGGSDKIAEIVKLSPKMNNGRVEVLASYMLPDPGVSATVFTGIESDGNYLFFTLAGANAQSKIYKIKINSNGTLGKSGYEVFSGQEINLANSIEVVRANTLTGYYNDVIIWGSNDIMVLLANGSTTCTLVSLARSNLANGTAANQTGLGNYINIGGNSDSLGYAITKKDNYIFIKTNTTSGRYITLFNTITDISTNSFIKTSGNFNISRDYAPANSLIEGISTGNHEDILEVSSTTSNGKFISRRSFENALWAENQICYYSDTNTESITFSASPMTFGDFTFTLDNINNKIDVTVTDGGAYWHTYQLDGHGTLTSSTLAIYDGKLYINVGNTGTHYFAIKILQSESTMQLHSFLDSNNILLSDNVSCVTPIMRRQFKPEEFSDIRNVPHKNYMCVGYGDEGFSILHLDEFFSDRTGNRLARYDIRLIKAWHFKASIGSYPNVSGSNIICANVTTRVESIFVEKDVIYVSVNVNGDDTLCFVIIDLKNGTAIACSDGKVWSGGMYQGSLSERNDGLAYSSMNNDNLDLSYFYIRKIHARTFTKEDESDYKGENPVTFAALGSGSDCDLLRIDWDSEGNRTPTKVCKNVISTLTQDVYAIWIAPSGILFEGQYYTETTPGLHGHIDYTNEPVWEINESNYSNISRYENALGSYIVDIAPNSKCWKTTGGWRHILGCVTEEKSGNASTQSVALSDIENESTERIIYSDETQNREYSYIDISDDKIFFSRKYESGSWIGIYEKLRFDDDLESRIYNNWTQKKNPNLSIDSSSRPLMYINSSSSSKPYLRYCNNNNILCVGNNGGLQMFYFSYLNDCFHETEDLEVDNIENYNYIKNGIDVDGERTIKSGKDINMNYIDGATATWSIGSDYNRIAEDGVTEGYFENVYAVGGYDYIGINFIKGNDCGEAKVTITEDPNGTPINIIDGDVVDLYDAENGESEDLEFIYWVSLNKNKEYNIKVEHSGDHNSNAVSPYYVTVRCFFVMLNIYSEITSRLTLTHGDHSFYVADYILEDGSHEITKMQDFTANGTNDTFVLVWDGDRAYKPLRFGTMVSGGNYPDDVTWYAPDDFVDVTWGSNATDYDDEIIDSEAHFGIKFTSPPAAGTVYIEYVPTSNKAVIKHTLNMPYSGAYEIRNKKPILLDFGIELI